MGRVIIKSDTTKNPISLIGEYAGICWNADTSDKEKNYQRGISCIKSGHGRTMEFPDVYMILDGYSARVIREFYTHIGGAPTRLQSSTRYINYQKGFEYITPPSLEKSLASSVASQIYKDTMKNIQKSIQSLEKLGVPREDTALLLPLAMSTTVAVKMNSRTLTDMSRQRQCSRAYWEFRELFKDISESLKNYSPEWKTFVEMNFMPKCEVYGYCPEKKSCGRKPTKQENT